MRKILWGILLLSILLSLYPVLRRYRAETSSRSVEVAMDYGDFRQLCAQEGLPIESTLIRFKKAGITSIAIPEITLDALYRSGGISWIRGEDLKLFSRKIAVSNPPLPSVLIFVRDKKVARELDRSFRALFGPTLFSTIPGGFLLRGKWEDLSQIGLGILPEQIRPLEKLGFLIDPRLENPADVSLPKVRYLLSALGSDSQISTLIFSGLRNEVLGFDDNLEVTADFLKDNNLRFGYVEVYDPGHVQKGSTDLAERIPSQVVKVQALVLPQMTRVSPDLIVSTFSLGVRERNVRVVYYRPILTSFEGMSALETNLHSLTLLWESLRRGGFEPGKASTLPPIEPGFFGLFDGAIGTMAAFFILVFCFVDLGPAVVAAGFLGIIALSLLTTAIHREGDWVSIVAFVAAVTFPILSVVIFSRGKPSSFFAALFALLKATVLTICGGFLVSALLAGNLTMLGVEEFRGVKGVLILPVVFAVWLAWLFHTQKERAKGIAEAAGRLLSPFKKPATLAHLALLVAVGAAGGIMVLRSGNQGAVAVSSWEKMFRIFLETTLRARPRFKELIGNPLFILSGLYGIDCGPGFLLLVCGSVGQADVMDSFAHLHTPLHYTLLRTFHGFWIGALIGWIFWAIAGGFSGKKKEE